MRIDNSAWGSRDFVEELAGKNQSHSQTDSTSSIQDNQEQLKSRINSIKSEGLSLKPLTQALQQMAQHVLSPIMITESMVDTNQRNGRETIIKAIRK